MINFQALLDQVQLLPVSFQLIDGCVLLVRDGEQITLEEAQSNLDACQGNIEKAEFLFNRFYIIHEFIDGRADYSELSAPQLLEVARALVELFKAKWRKTAPERDCLIKIDGAEGAGDEPLELCITSNSVYRNGEKPDSNHETRLVRKRPRFYVISAIFAVLFIGGVFLSPTPTNCWMLVTGNGFFIPDESSVFAFRITQMNPGSGEWWLHGEDKRFYFTYGQTEGAIYHAFPKEKLSECSNLDPLDFETWCERFVLTKTSPKVQVRE
ncbi:MAG: hypothetical protein AAF357_04865 [Verrucomicrobiota bacterium]